MTSYIVQIGLSADQLKRFYSGRVQYVWTRDEQGTSLQFPLQALRPFVTHDGVAGRFRVRVSAEQRLLGIERIDM